MSRECGRWSEASVMRAMRSRDGGKFEDKYGEGRSGE